MLAIACLGTRGIKDCKALLWTVRLSFDSRLRSFVALLLKISWRRFLSIRALSSVEAWEEAGWVTAGADCGRRMSGEGEKAPVKSREALRLSRTFKEQGQRRILIRESCLRWGEGSRRCGLWRGGIDSSWGAFFAFRFVTGSGDRRESWSWGHFGTNQTEGKEDWWWGWSEESSKVDAKDVEQWVFIVTGSGSHIRSDGEKGIGTVFGGSTCFKYLYNY